MDHRPLASDSDPVTPWSRHLMALDDVADRLQRITGAFAHAGVPFALVGGQAVAMWVATRDPAAVRTTKDVDVLLDARDLPAARKAALSVDMDYFEVLGTGMFLDRLNANPRHAVHLVWAGRKVIPEHVLPAPDVAECVLLAPGVPVVSLAALVRMKLLANRDQDRVHLRDLIGVGLVERDLMRQLPPQLAARLDPLLSESGR